MKKEILTREMVERDIRNTWGKQLRYVIIGISLWALMFIGMVYSIVVLLIREGPIVYYILPIVYLIICMPAVLRSLYKMYVPRFCCAIKPFRIRKTFHIVTASVSQIDEKQYYDRHTPVEPGDIVFPSYRFTEYPYKPYCFYFSTAYQEGFSLLNNEHYSWSAYPMRDQVIRNTTEIGDEFYLAVDGDQIAYIYPAKYFEWKES